MGLLKLLGDLFIPTRKEQVETKTLSGKTINGLPLEDVSFSEILPWSYTLVNDDVTIGQTILLWWLDTSKDITYKPNYLESNYIESFDESVHHLNLLGYLDKYQLTKKGKCVVNDNFKYVELHRNNWLSDRDKSNNTKIYIKENEKRLEQLESAGLHESANRQRALLERTKRHAELRPIFVKAERLSIAKEYSESNAILLGLKERNYTQMKPLMNRMAINYRGLKEYANEIAVIDEYITRYYPEYNDSSDMTFLERRKKAIKLLDKL